MPKLPTQIDHTEMALDGLPSQFQDKATFEAWISALMSPFDELEQVFMDLLLLRALDVAVGMQLDNIGGILGRARNGQDDATYRLYLKAQILCLVSSGKDEEIYRIFRLLVPATATLELEDKYPAGFILKIGNHVLTESDATSLADILRVARGGGINAQLHYIPAGESSIFSLSSQSGTLETSSSTGLAPSDQTTGGQMSGVKQA